MIWLVSSRLLPVAQSLLSTRRKSTCRKSPLSESPGIIVISGVFSCTSTLNLMSFTKVEMTIENNVGRSELPVRVRIVAILLQK